MMKWEDYPTYSLGDHYDVVMHKDGSWFVVTKNFGALRFPVLEHTDITFDTRSDAKQFVEIHYAVGA